MFNVLDKGLFHMTVFSQQQILIKLAWEIWEVCKISASAIPEVLTTPSHRTWNATFIYISLSILTLYHSSGLSFEDCMYAAPLHGNLIINLLKMFQQFWLSEILKNNQHIYRYIASTPFMPNNKWQKMFHTSPLPPHKSKSTTCLFNFLLCEVLYRKQTHHPPVKQHT
jgi:hypothetical protein